MKINKQLSVMALAVATLFSSCDSFLEVRPKGIIIPETMEDYDAVLNAQEVLLTYPPALLYCTDDYYDEFDELNVGTAANAYFWRPGLDATERETPAIWGDYYTCIYHANVVINNVMDADGGSYEGKLKLLSEALVYRANAYFHLLTAFAKVYDSATAAQSPGVPLVSSTDMTDAIPPRASVQTVMDTIIANLQFASEHLPTTAPNRYRVSRYVVDGLLSRIYLYMGNYVRAGEYADRALEAPHTFLDFNDYASRSQIPASELSPEVLWWHGSSDYSVPGSMTYDDGLLALFGSGDLRHTLLTAVHAVTGYIYYSTPSGRANFGITFPELYLTKAETLARSGEVASAMDILNDLRSYRIQRSVYVDLEASTPEEALGLILDDRRRELAFLGVRWMDMKRLDREGRMPEVRRVRKDTGEVLATLAPHSPAYTFQIPARVQQFNPDIELNER